MKSLVLFSALCTVALGSHWGGVGAGYAGVWAHGAAPLGPNGVVVDTPEVAAAKAEHLHAVANVRSNGLGVGVLGAGVLGAGVLRAGVLGAGVLGAGVLNGGWAVNNGQWNGDNGAVWAGHDNGQWHGEGVIDGAAYSGAGIVAGLRAGVYAAGHAGALNDGQWNGDNGAVWAGHDNGQWHGEGVIDGAAYSGAGIGAGLGAGVYAAGHAGALNNGQWSAALWGDNSAHGHGRWRRGAVLAYTPAATVPLAHSVAIAHPIAAPIAVAPVGVHGLGLGLGLGHAGLIHG